MRFDCLSTKTTGWTFEIIGQTIILKNKTIYMRFLDRLQYDYQNTTTKRPSIDIHIRLLGSLQYDYHTTINEHIRLLDRLQYDYQTTINGHKDY